MTILAFNTPLTHGLRGKYQAILGVLPFGLMFAAFLPLIFFAAWLNRLLGILPSSPPNSPNGTLWLLGFLAGMVALMSLGYVLGWIANAAIAMLILGWSAQQAVAVFIRSEVPPHWLQQGTASTSEAIAQSHAKWEEQRKGGAARFILARGVVAWGFPLFVGMYLGPVLLGTRVFTAGGLVINLALWLVGGAAFGASMWLISESTYRKRKGRQ